MRIRQTFRSLRDDHIHHITIGWDGVLKLLKSQPRKASGPDMTPARILENLAEEFASILTEFFQRTLAGGEVPVD